MSEYAKTILAISVHKSNESANFGEGATHVCIDDEGGGPYLILKQSNDWSENGEIRLEFEELPLIVEAANQLINQTGFKDIE